MANRSTEIGRIMRAGDTILARQMIRRAIEASRGNLRATARLLGVSNDTVERLVLRLALENDLDAARREAAWWRYSPRSQARLLE